MSSGSPLIAAFARAQQQVISSPNNDTILDNDVSSDDDTSFEGFDPEPLSGEGTNDAEPESSPTDGRKRKLQQVSTIQARIKVVKWMVEDEKENGKRRLFTRVLKEFPGDFRGTQNANFMKAARYLCPTLICI
jgi:hypothetical protein